MQGGLLDAMRIVDTLLATTIKQMRDMLASNEKMLARAHENYSCAIELASQLVCDHGLGHNVHPERYSRRMYCSVSGALVARRFLPSHSIFLSARMAKLPNNTVSVSGPE